MTKDLYAVLGVNPDDDPTIIKRRYRQLVRQFHPDIAADREAAHEKMLAINEAWTILSDPAERARYDRTRAPVFIPRPQTAADYPQHGTGTKGAPTKGKSRVEGWVGGASSSAGAQSAGGTTRPASPRPPTPRTANPSRPAPRARSANAAASRGTNTRTRMLTMVFEAAELYFFQGRAQEAIDMCTRVMKYDPHNAEAPALLGDIYAEQGRHDIAISMYQTAVRNQPKNMLYRQKLDALGGAAQAGPVGAKQSENASSGFYATTFSTSSSAKSSNPTSRPGVRNPLDTPSRKVSTTLAMHKETRTVVAAVLLVIAVALVVWANVTDDGSGTTISMVPHQSTVSAQLLAATALGALLVGIALPLLNLAGRCCQLRPREARWKGWPALLLTAAAGAVAFPLAFVMLIISRMVGREWQRSTLVVLLSALCWSSTLALNVPEELTLPTLSAAALWWSGRLIFPMMVIGWAFGSQASQRY